MAMLYIGPERFKFIGFMSGRKHNPVLIFSNKLKSQKNIFY